MWQVRCFDADDDDADDDDDDDDDDDVDDVDVSGPLKFDFEAQNFQKKRT